MDNLSKYFEDLSIRSEARAIKVSIATLIAVFIGNHSKYIDTTTTCLTVYLVYAMFFTVSGSRNYAKQRILSNLYALVVSIIIGFIFKWNMYALAIVFFLIMIVYYKFNLDGKISLLSTGAAAIIFYAGATPNTIVHRFIALAVGFTIAILTNEIILPTNNGLLVQKNLRRIEKYIFKAQDSIIKNKSIRNIDSKKLLNDIKNSSEDIALLEKEIKSRAFRNHLRNYVDKVKIFRELNKVCNTAYAIIDYLNAEEDSFNTLTHIEKDFVIDVLTELSNAHKRLVNNIINDNREEITELEVINYKIVSFRNNFKIILMSKLLQYQEGLNTLARVAK